MNIYFLSNFSLASYILRRQYVPKALAVQSGRTSFSKPVFSSSVTTEFHTLRRMKILFDSRALSTELLAIIETPTFRIFIANVASKRWCDTICRRCFRKKPWLRGAWKGFYLRFHDQTFLQFHQDHWLRPRPQHPRLFHLTLCVCTTVADALQDFKEYPGTVSVGQKAASFFGENSKTVFSTAISECIENPCSPGTCSASSGHIICVCPDGYEERKGRCVSINQCAPPKSPCAPGSCIPVPGSYKCVCPKNYNFNDGKCVAVNECEENPDVCSPGTCVSQYGTYRCNCPNGFYFSDGACLGKCGHSLN